MARKTASHGSFQCASGGWGYTENNVKENRANGGQKRVMGR